jgi:hypothetical protein
MGLYPVDPNYSSRDEEFLVPLLMQITCIVRLLFIA